MRQGRNMPIWLRCDGLIAWSLKDVALKVFPGLAY